MTTSSAGDVRDFFDRQNKAEQYQAMKAVTSQIDRKAASLLNTSARGDVLSIGGVWEFFRWTEHMSTLTVLDLSAAMLSTHCPAGAARSRATSTPPSSSPVRSTRS